MRYKPNQNVGHFRRVSTGLVQLSAVCLLLCVHGMGPSSFGQNSGGSNAAVKDEGVGLRRKLLAPAFKMLKVKGVPFDPKLLLDMDWRSQIEPALAQMPELSQTLRVTEPMEGLYLAGTVLLPEHVSLTGDTLILTRELAPDDENSMINIEGPHRLFIFNIYDTRKFEAMERHRPRGQYLNINVEAPCAIVGIAPMYRGKYRCRGMSYVGGWTRPS